VLLHDLKGRAPVTDMFGRQDRACLAGLELPIDERLTVHGALGEPDLLGQELGRVDRATAEQAGGDQDVGRLMTIPGVEVTTVMTLGR
jgi:transposase